MKTTHLMLMAAVAIGASSLTGCSDKTYEPDDSTLDAGNAIRFAVNTELTRAGDITTNNLSSFYVYAFTDVQDTPSLFMDNVEVTKNSTNVWTYSPVEYWPAGKTVDFYAYAPAGWVGLGAMNGPVAYESYPGTQDIIYAVCADMKGNTGMANAQVLLNFRHALSKVTLKLSSTNSDLQVKVSNVALSHIRSKGNFYFPTVTTSPDSGDGVGHWEDQNTPVPYLFHMSQAADDVITLTSTPSDMSNSSMGLGGSKYLVPQPLPWTSDGGETDAYITVMCSIYDSHTGAKLWPNANTPEDNIVEGSTFGDGLLKFPLATSSFTSWKPGYHYIYNLVINSNDEMGAIEFGTPTVDSYVDVSTIYE